MAAKKNHDDDEPKTKAAEKKDDEKKSDEPKAKKKAAPTAVPVTVNNLTSRSDEDALEGLFVDVVSGDHQGRRGAYEQTLTHDPETGYPATILVRTRDAENEALVVDYEDARPAAGYSGGR